LGKKRVYLDIIKSGGFMLNKKSGIVLKILSIVCLLAIATSGLAQTPTFQVSVDRLFFNRYPQLDAYVSILDAQGFPILDLDKEPFSVRLDGVETQSFTVEPYTNMEETLAIVLAIDTSGSMDNPKKPTPLDNAVAAAKNFVSQLSDQDLVALVTFAEDVTIRSELTTDKDKIISALNTLKPAGATAMNDAIVESIDILKNREERRSIILLTDGKPQGDQVFTYDQAFAHASNFKIPFYPIGFGAVDEKQLQRLAKATGGSEQIKPNSTELTNAFNRILGVFREQYYLKVNSDMEADNLDHELQVSLTYEGGEASAVNTFVARDPVILSVTKPENGASLNGVVPVVAEIDAMNTIIRVDFYIGEEMIHSAISSPYQADFDTTQFVTGEYDIIVRAYDDLGFKAEETVDVLVELQRQDWIFWLIGLIVLIGAALFISLGLRKKRAVPEAAASGSGAARLLELEGVMPGKEWLLPQGTTRLGRKADTNDIPLKGLGASRVHALIERTKSGCMIRSLKPDNPAIVNGRKVNSTALHPGDTIEMGESKFRFE
jgi:VWFA-related protein